MSRIVYIYFFHENIAFNYDARFSDKSVRKNNKSVSHSQFGCCKMTVIGVYDAFQRVKIEEKYVS